MYALTSTDPSDITIAVIDTAIDKDHPDLQRCCIQEICLVKSTGNTLHGTAVAGIIAAYPADEEGALGIAPQVNILSISAAENAQSITIDDMIKGIDLAVEKEADIINISSGFYIEDENLHAAIRRAYDAGIVIVASAGNTQDGSVMYPAKFDEAIAVSSYDKDHTKMYDYKEGKIVYLPGNNIVTTMARIENNDYGYFSVTGTSFATPMMSGIIALLLNNNGAMTNKDILKIISSYHGELITKEEVDKIVSYKTNE